MCSLYGSKKLFDNAAEPSSSVQVRQIWFWKSKHIEQVWGHCVLEGFSFLVSILQTENNSATDHVNTRNQTHIGSSFYLQMFC